VVGLLLFALFNSSDVFLLLKMREVTGSDTTTILAYVFYNMVFALASYPLGGLADRFGLKNVFSAGLLLFAAVYTLFATATSTPWLFAAFFLYGIYAAATEGIAKAWITNLAHDTNTATAVGFYTSFQSICALLASVVAGAIWTGFGAGATFLVTAVGALSIYLYIRLILRRF